MNRPRLPTLPMRLRKLLGMVVLLTFLAFYIMLVIALAAAKLPESWWGQLLFFAVAGLIWIVPVRYLFLWMERPDRPR